MNENLDLRVILKDVKGGTKLYSTLFGEVDFVRAESIGVCPIIIKLKDGTVETVTEDGRYISKFKDGECTLFPSKEQRDWSKFTAKYYFKPFDKVIVRNGRAGAWKVDFFSHELHGGYVTTSGFYSQCIPYEGNENMVGVCDRER